MPTNPFAAKLITLAAPAGMLSTSTKTVRRAIATGVLPAYRMSGGRDLRIKVADLEKMLTPVNPGVPGPWPGR